jgi:hypothetical protein
MLFFLYDVTFAQKIEFLITYIKLIMNKKKSRNKPLLNTLSRWAAEIYSFFFETMRVSAVPTGGRDSKKRKNYFFHFIVQKKKLKIYFILFLESWRPTEIANTLVVSKNSRKQCFVQN